MRVEKPISSDRECNSNHTAYAYFTAGLQDLVTNVTRVEE